MPDKQTELRRYLVEIDTLSTQQLFTDCLVIGAGIAGLRAAIEASGSCNVIVTCKDDIGKSNTWNAQGGIASVLDKSDSFRSHIDDTLKAGSFLNDHKVVEMVVEKGPELLRQLSQWGTEFDAVEGKIDITLEGGHSHARVAHAHGDSTGRAIAESMIKKARSVPSIKIMEKFFCIDLITNDDGHCVGAIGMFKGNMQIIWAKQTILATGGAGRLYRETTNPEVATGDGLAMAYRAGAVLSDLEFVQFHPTTLYIAGASRALITETLRGEGAVLLDCNGYPFMKDYNESAELAPRDIVSRAILAQMLKTGSTHVYLDVRHFDKCHFAKRFPLITELCESFDIDVSKDLIPVRPSAHYMVGGVKSDINGRTSIENLYVCGEAAATGLHGANRLGSNSLLEGLVFGKISGSNAAECSAKINGNFKPYKLNYTIIKSDRSRLDTVDVTNSLRALMWRNVGITRREKPLNEAMEIINFWQRYVMDKQFDTVDGWQCQNMLTLSMLIAKAALKREESRGVHYRQDFPKSDENYNQHFDISKDGK